MNFTERALLAAALGLALALPALAQDNSADLFADAISATAPAADAAAPAAGAFSLGLAGGHEFGYRFPAYSSSTSDYDGEMKPPYFGNELDLGAQDGAVKLVSNWKLDLRPLATDAKGERGSWDQLVRARPLENYVSWSPAGLKLSAGYQIFSWGVADKKNPTDNLNPRDFTVGVNADKVPVLAADAIWYPSDSVSIEGVFLPSAQNSIYPVDFKAEVDASAAKIAARLTPALTGLYRLKYGNPAWAVTATAGAATDDALALDPENAIAGGKLNYKSAAFDASLSYLYDFDPFYTPIFSTTATVTSATSATVATAVSLERERIHRIGLDAKTTLGKFGLWTEAAYSLTKNDGSSDDYEYRRSKLDYVVGTDFNFGPNDSGYVNLQYIGAWTPGYDDSFYADLAANKIADPTAVYQRAIVEALGLDTEGLLQGATVNVKYEIADATFTPQITAVVAAPFLYDDTQQKRYCSVALNPEIDVKPVDSFHIKLGADLAYAWVKPAGGEVELDTTTDKIGAYTPSNNVYLKILYKWNLDLKK
jgi:hypothetical protein